MPLQNLKGLCSQESLEGLKDLERLERQSWESRFFFAFKKKHDYMQKYLFLLDFRPGRYLDSRPEYLDLITYILLCKLYLQLIKFSRSIVIVS